MLPAASAGAAVPRVKPNASARGWALHPLPSSGPSVGPLCLPPLEAAGLARVKPARPSRGVTAHGRPTVSGYDRICWAGWLPGALRCAEDAPREARRLQGAQGLTEILLEQQVGKIYNVFNQAARSDCSSLIQRGRIDIPCPPVDGVEGSLRAS